jgi:hypothetical protein
MVYTVTATQPPAEISPSIHCIGGWFGYRASLDAVEKSLLPPPGTEPYSQVNQHVASLLYQLSYLPSKGVCTVPKPNLHPQLVAYELFSSKRDQYQPYCFITEYK